jgi:hypothetical protein
VTDADWTTLEAHHTAAYTLSVALASLSEPSLRALGVTRADVGPWCATVSSLSRPPTVRHTAASLLALCECCVAIDDIDLAAPAAAQPGGDDGEEPIAKGDHDGDAADYTRRGDAAATRTAVAAAVRAFADIAAAPERTALRVIHWAAPAVASSLGVGPWSDRWNPQPECSHRRSGRSAGGARRSRDDRSPQHRGGRRRGSSHGGRRPPQPGAVHVYDDCPCVVGDGGGSDVVADDRAEHAARLLRLAASLVLPLPPGPLRTFVLAALWHSAAAWGIGAAIAGIDRGRPDPGAARVADALAGMMSAGLAGVGRSGDGGFLFFL